MKKHSLFLGLFLLGTCSATELRSNDIQRAAQYLESQKGHALLVFQNDEMIHEAYFNGWAADKAHRLASGTKSFTGAMLAAAAEDKLLSLDERVSDTLTEWKDTDKTDITLRQLLSLTSGLHGGNIGQVPTYTEAVKQADKRWKTGSKFSYGPVPFQVLGEVMRRKLAVKKEDVPAYIERRILAPIGCAPSGWIGQATKQPRLPSGVRITAREWAKFGKLILHQGEWDGQQIISSNALANCFTPSKTNPAYGLGFWLRQTPDKKDQLIMAAGAGKQKLYIVPARNILVVQFAESQTYNESRFLALLFGQTSEVSLPAWFKRWDKNGDGKLALDEVRDPARHKKADADKDGFVSPAELRAVLQPR